MTYLVLSPHAAARRAAEVAAGAAGQRSGFLFGPERSGLTNEDLRLADALVQIPTYPLFSSLNLAQSVNILAYESWLARGEVAAAAGRAEGDSYEAQAGRPAAADGQAVAGGQAAAGGAGGLLLSREKGADGQLADKAQVEALFTRLEGALDRADFQRDPAKRRVLYQKVRNVFLRAGLTGREAETLQGVVTSLTRPTAAPTPPSPPA